MVAIPAGLEPATRGVEIRYSIQLSYGTIWHTGGTSPSRSDVLWHPHMKILLIRQDDPNRI